MSSTVAIQFNNPSTIINSFCVTKPQNPLTNFNQVKSVWPNK